MRISTSYDAIVRHDLPALRDSFLRDAEYAFYRPLCSGAIHEQLERVLDSPATMTR